MKPGDLIEWVYKSDSQSVNKHEELWSTPLRRWVPIGIQPAILVSITDEFYSWLTTRGLFHAHVLDVDASPRFGRGPAIVPRVIGEHR
jgi:hypothetical protein